MNSQLASATTLDDVVELARALIAIDSSNPSLVAEGAGAGEGAVCDFVTEWLVSRGFSCTRLESTPGRPSIVAIAAGSGGGKSLMFNGHLDTVSLVTYENGNGLVADVRDGNLYGRGSYDMKSGIAAMMVAAHRAHQQPHRGDIVLALVADEEFASSGTEEVLRHITTDAALVVEPSGMDVVVAHRGFVWATVTVHGRAAHGSRRDLGIDAIVKAGSFLTALGDLDIQLAARPLHPVLGTANVHASTIVGGEESSSFPASCTINLERRTLPGENGAVVLAELRSLVDAITSRDSDFVADVEITYEREPFMADAQSPVITALTNAATLVLGRAPVTRGEPFWTDCALLQGAGISAVLFGVDGGGAHAATEWVSVASLNDVTETLVRTALEFTNHLAS